MRAPVRRAALRSQHLKRKRLSKAATYAVLSLWALVCLFPLYWVAVTSLKGEFEIGQGPFYVPFLDFLPTLDSWKFILWDKYDNLLLEFFNSVTVGLSSTILTVAVGSLAVYGLTRFQIAVSWIAVAVTLFLAAFFTSAFFFGWTALDLFFVLAIALLLLSRRWLSGRSLALNKNAIFVGLWATRILPPVVVVLPIYVMVWRTGLLDTRLSLVLTYTAANLPIAIWLLRPAFGERVTEQEEVAQLDGASRLRIITTILLPMAAAGVGAAALLVFILCWNEYLFAAYLAAQQAMTLPPWVVGQLSTKEAAVGGDIVEWSRLSAAMVLTIVPMLAFAVLAQRIFFRMSGWQRDQRHAAAENTH